MGQRPIGRTGDHGHTHDPHQRIEQILVVVQTLTSTTAAAAGERKWHGGMLGSRPAQRNTAYEGFARGR
jgi:hypothetical protein